MIIDGFQTFETPEEYIDFEQMCFVGSIRDDGAEWFDGSEESVRREFMTYFNANSIDTVEFKSALDKAMPDVIRETMATIKEEE